MTTLQPPPEAPARPPTPRPRGGARGALAGAPWPLVAGAGVAGLLAVTPLVYLAVRALEPGLATFLEILGRPRTGELLVRSVALAGAVTAACLVVGVAAAWLVTRTDLPGRRAWAVLLALPLAVPSYVAGFTWIAEWPSLAGFWGAFAVLTAVSFPYVLLPVTAALRGGDGGLEEVARSLGHGPVRVLLQVTLRRVWPAATAGGLLVALYVLSDFGAVSLMRYDAFTLGIYTSYRATFDRTPAAVLGCVLVALAAVITWGESRARGRAAARVGRGVARAAAPVRLGRWRPAGLGFVAAVVAVSLGIPAYSLTRWTLVGSSAGVDWGSLGSAAAVTIQVAGLGALLTTVLAVPVGVLSARHRSRLSAGLETAAYAGHALPGVTVGLALVFAGIRLFPGLYQETPLLVVGYAVLFLPLAIGAVRTAVAAAPPRLEEVSRSLGHGRLATFARVTLPLAGPGVAAGAALVFLTAAKELPITLMLRPTGADTLAVQLWSHTGAGAFAAAAPYAVVLVLVAAVPTLLLQRGTMAERGPGRRAVPAGGARPAPEVPVAATERTGGGG
ncbi:MAG TPA: iron ABC transporter permease [Pseudonocardia sp.]|nr:iron ABC transporter permease [Pseudonocardia sp.]